jgi:hypothetical protein
MAKKSRSRAPWSSGHSYELRSVDRFPFSLFWRPTRPPLTNRFRHPARAGLEKEARSSAQYCSGSFLGITGHLTGVGLKGRDASRSRLHEVFHSIFDIHPHISGHCKRVIKAVIRRFAQWHEDDLTPQATA